METAKADAVKEFRASQTLIDACAEYYGDGFEDCLKQVKSIYPYLDFSKVSMDDPLPSTPVGDTTLEENDDSTESEANPEDDSVVVLAQPAMDKLVVPLTPLAIRLGGLVGSRHPWTYELVHLMDLLINLSICVLVIFCRKTH